ncbi:MAG: bifunctional 5,10-methylenetetrahydrofolate dehydrogenase/5,10-methenyltetrahydrofolate cyclohydrolase [Chloroflexi bacterium]|nr:bifunctional 5,10-methylenetetrahydrofolate dehydrogenase/5,10-methenyltetrahydrofolate cyclohydrolase [Chloroflexota bacterium]
MVARVIDGTAIAARVRARLAGEIEAFTKRFGIAPSLSVVLVGEDPASVTYVGAKEKASREAGMISEAVRLPATSSKDRVITAVESLNRDPARQGILVQLPLPRHIDPDVVVQAIDPTKDVDGLHPYNLGLLLAGRPRFAPATPSGIQQLLIEENVETSGAHVVICGRSNIVGRPLAAILLGRGKGANSTVTVCHTGTRDLKVITRSADILVAAAGQPDLIRGDMIRPGAVVIDVGVNRINDPGRKSGFRLVGDVKFDEAVDVASLITPVPGGVGPMTIAMLLRNTLVAALASRAGK